MKNGNIVLAGQTAVATPTTSVVEVEVAGHSKVVWWGQPRIRSKSDLG